MLEAIMDVKVVVALGLALGLLSGKETPADIWRTGSPSFKLAWLAFAATYAVWAVISLDG
jgi:hypothetical protein